VSCAISERSCVRDCGAVAAVLAVPTVMVEKNQMRPDNPIVRFIDPKETLHRGGGTAFRDWVELSNVKTRNRLRRPDRAGTSAGLAHWLPFLDGCTSSLRFARWLARGFCRRRTTSLPDSPDLLGFAHSLSCRRGS